MHREVVINEGEGFTIDGGSIGMKTAEDAEDAEEPQKEIQDFASSLPQAVPSEVEGCLCRRCFLRWRASSYITMPPATDTFRDGTRPSMGIETTKSHLRR